MNSRIHSSFKSLLITILLISFFLFNMVLPSLNFSSDELKVYAKKSGIPLQDFSDGAWMHVDTFVRENDSVLEEYAEALVRSNIKTIFILAKKIDGSVNFPSKNALKRSFADDPMKRVVAALRTRDIEVFFYFPINTDPAWNDEHPEDIAWKYGTVQEKTSIQDPERKLVNLLSSKYQEYIRLLVEDAFKLYDIQGIQLDYIRFRNAHWGFSEQELSIASKRGVNLNRIKELTYATFVKPGDWNTLLKKYDEKDPDVLKWVECREDIVFNFAHYLSKYTKKLGKKFACTLIHSGASQSAYGAVHFSQSYPRISSIADLVVPMAYHGSNTQVRKLVQEVIDGSKKQVAPHCKIMIGIQAYETPTRLLMEAAGTVHSNDLGFVMFRVGTFALVDLHLAIQENEKIMLHAQVFNTIPQQSIHGFEVRGLGALIQMEDNCWDKEQCLFEDGFKIWGSVFSDKIGSFSLSLPSKTNPGYLADFLQPMAVVADAKTDLPTYTSAVQFNHFILNTSLSSLKTVEASHPVQFRVSGGIGFIRAEDLSYFGFDVKEESNARWSFIQGERITIFDFNTNVIKYGKDSHFLEYPEAWPRITSGWIPVRLFFELFAYTLFYNAQRKEIHLLKALSTRNQEATSAYVDYADIQWLLCAGDLVEEPLHEYIKDDFYQKSALLHSKGRWIQLVIHNDWKFSSQADTIFWMLRERSSPWYLPDTIKWRK